MTKRMYCVFLLCLLASGAWADFAYDCRDQEGRKMGFTTTSLFGFDNDPIFSLEDAQAKIDVTLMNGDIRVLEGGEQWQIIGALRHGLYASFFASFTRVFGNTDNVSAQLKLKDSFGQDRATYAFLCRFSWQ